MAAAIRAARNGVQVLLIESKSMVGGTGLMAGGTEVRSCENISGILEELRARLAAKDGSRKVFKPQRSASDDQMQTTTSKPYEPSATPLATASR